MEKVSMKFVGYVLIILLILTLVIITPFFSAIVLGIVFAYMFHPSYCLISKRIKHKSVAASISAILIVLIILIPTAFVVDRLTVESSQLYKDFRDITQRGDMVECNSNNFFCKTVNNIRAIVSNPTVRLYGTNALIKLNDNLKNKVNEIVSKIPYYLMSLLIMLATIYLVLRDGESMLETFKQIIPLKKAQVDDIFKEIDDVVSTILYGVIFSAALQGIIGGIVFYLLGLNAPVFWGLMITIAFVMPVIGGWMIWGTFGLTMLLQGIYASNSVQTMKGGILLAVGLLILTPLALVIIPWMLDHKVKIHPIIILLGVFGGMAVFGATGFIIGPIILAVLGKVIQIYIEYK